MGIKHNQLLSTHPKTEFKVTRAGALLRARRQNVLRLRRTLYFHAFRCSTFCRRAPPAASPLGVRLDTANEHVGRTYYTCVTPWWGKTQDITRNVDEDKPTAVLKMSPDAAGRQKTKLPSALSPACRLVLLSHRFLHIGSQTPGP
ncbi:hypothetical protein Bbelb_139760 [Branchiostoma belcheri]|nr:hypothetical protein Bbelb_139760 [Branchiostoma belcheri]